MDKLNLHFGLTFDCLCVHTYTVHHGRDIPITLLWKKTKFVSTCNMADIGCGLRKERISADSLQNFRKAYCKLFFHGDLAKHGGLELAKYM